MKYRELVVNYDQIITNSANGENIKLHVDGIVQQMQCHINNIHAWAYGWVSSFICERPGLHKFNVEMQAHEVPHFNVVAVGLAFPVDEVRKHFKVNCMIRDSKKFEDFIKFYELQQQRIFDTSIGDFIFDVAE